MKKNRHLPVKKQKKPIELIQFSSDFHKAVMLQKSGQFEKAGLIYNRILDKDPNNADALHLLGLVEHQKGNTLSGMELIKKAITLQPANIKFHLNLGRILKSTGQFTQALDCFDNALKINTDFSDAHFNKGIACQNLGQYDNAVLAYKKAIKIDPKNIEAYNNLGGLYALAKKPEKALDCLNKALTLKGDHADVFNNIGNIKKAQGNLDEAESFYRRAIHLKPDNAEFHCNLGNLLSDKKEYTQAISAYRHSIGLCPGYYLSHYNLANLLFEIDRPLEAIASYEKSITLRPGFFQGWYNLGLLYMAMGRNSDASVCLKKVLEIEPHYTKVFQDLARMKKFCKGDAEIEKMFLLYDDPQLNETQIMHLGFALGKVFEDIGEYDRAFHYLEKSNKIFRKSYSYNVKSLQTLEENLKNSITQEFFEKRKTIGYVSDKPVFILGMPRSGTSLVEQILSSHHLCRGGGELTYLSDILHEKWGTLNDPDFYNNIEKADMNVFEKMGKNYVDAISAHGDSRHITDKMPGNFIHIGLIRLLLPGAKIIHCRRNPMDTCFSIYKNYFSHLHKYANDLSETGHFYNFYKNIMAYWHRLLPGYIYDIDYEKIISNEAEEIRKLISFLGWEWDENCLLFHQNKRIVRTASDSQVRKPIYKDSVALWEHYKNHLKELGEIIGVSF